MTALLSDINNKTITTIKPENEENNQIFSTESKISSNQKQNKNESLSKLDFRIDYDLNKTQDLKEYCEIMYRSMKLVPI